MARKLSYQDLLSMDGQQVWVVDPLATDVDGYPAEYNTVDLKEMKLRTGPNIWDCWDIDKDDIDGEHPICLVYDTKPE